MFRGLRGAPLYMQKHETAYANVRFSLTTLRCQVAAAKAAGAEYVIVVQYEADPDQGTTGEPIDMSSPEGYGNASMPAADIPAVMVGSVLCFPLHFPFNCDASKGMPSLQAALIQVKSISIASRKAADG